MLTILRTGFKDICGILIVMNKSVFISYQGDLKKNFEGKDLYIMIVVIEKWRKNSSCNQCLHVAEKAILTFKQFIGNSKILMHADDSKLFRTIGSIDDAKLLKI